MIIELAILRVRPGEGPGLEDAVRDAPGEGRDLRLLLQIEGLVRHDPILAAQVRAPLAEEEAHGHVSVVHRVVDALHVDHEQQPPLVDRPLDDPVDGPGLEDVVDRLDEEGELVVDPLAPVRRHEVGPVARLRVRAIAHPSVEVDAVRHVAPVDLLARARAGEGS